RADADGTIFAIGDCAEVWCSRPDCEHCAGREGRGPAGLVGPGWRQASWLARRLTGGAEAMAAEPPDLILLKARSIDLVAAGRVTPEPWDDDGPDSADVAVWADPQHGRYAKMVTRDGVLVGAVCVGMPRTAAELTLLFEEGGEPPAHRTTLFRLDGGDASAAGTPPGPESTVCRCAKRVTGGGVLVGAVWVGMQRTAAELTLLFEQGGELPADRTTLFRLDGADASGSGTPPGRESTVCRCTGATLGAIEESIEAG